MLIRLVTSFFCVVVWVNQLSAQAPKPKNLFDFDRRQLHFGFALGTNSGSFSVARNPLSSPSDSLYGIESIKQPGFLLGIVSSVRFNPYLTLRLVPALSFAQRDLDFRFNGVHRMHTTKKVVESTYLEFPLLVKFSSARLNNFAAYIIGGAKYTFDLASNEKVKNENSQDIIVKINKNDYDMELGFGTDFYLPYFKFAIELKMAYGLRDILIHDNTIYSNSIEELRSKMFTLSFLFEG